MKTKFRNKKFTRTPGILWYVLSGLYLLTYLPRSFGAPVIVSTWVTNGGGDYATGANWDTGNVPDSADYGPRLIFGGSVTPGAVSNPSNTEVERINFETAGWTVTGSQILLRQINSSGTGTNLAQSIKTWGGGNNSWTIASGNILELNSLYLDGARNLSLSGGGVLQLNSEADGWSSSKSFTVNDATLEVSGDWAFNGSGTVNINNDAGILKLNDTLANVQARMGSSIIDNTTLGLSATDLGGGVIQVSVIPEPSTAALVLLSGLTALCVVRKRKS